MSYVQFVWKNNYRCTNRSDNVASWFQRLKLSTSQMKTYNTTDSDNTLLALCLDFQLLLDCHFQNDKTYQCTDNLIWINCMLLLKIVCNFYEFPKKGGKGEEMWRSPIPLYKRKKGEILKSEKEIPEKWLLYNNLRTLPPWKNVLALSKILMLVPPLFQQLLLFWQMASVLIQYNVQSLILVSMGDNTQ